MSDVRSLIEGEQLWYIWDAENVMVGFDQLHESQREIKGELLVRPIVLPNGSVNGHYLSGSYNLSSIETRIRTAERLAKITRTAGETWRLRLEYACLMASKRYRKGEAFQDISELEVPTHQEWLIDKLLPTGHIAGIMAEGGSGKGWIALAVVLALACNQPLPGGLRPNREALSLYLDWELDGDSTRRRLEWLARGFGVDVPRMIYRRMDRPLADDLGIVKAQVQTEGVGLVIVDSAVPATGGEAKDTDCVLRFMRAMREIEASKFLLGHITKASAQSTGPQRATYYGNAFYQYLVRNAWQIRAKTVGSDLYQAWVHEKFNLSEQFGHFGWHIAFDKANASATVERYDVENTKDLAERATAHDRLRNLLLRHSGVTVDEAAEALGLTPEVVRTTLSRYKSTFVRAGERVINGRSVQTWGVSGEKLTGNHSG